MFCVSMDAQKSFVETGGDIGQLLLPATAAVSTLIYTDDSKPTLQYAKSFLVTFGITHGLKRLINKQRPNGGDYAFPSGHTSVAFVSAAFIERRYGWKYGVPAYALASYVAWSRVDAEKHDWIDVSAGAVLGLAVAYIFTKPYNVGNTELAVGLQANSIGLKVKF